MMRPLGGSLTVFVAVTGVYVSIWLVPSLRRRLRALLLPKRLLVPPSNPPTFCIASANHRHWLQPVLERHGWRAGVPTSATLVWQISKKVLPKETCPVLNSVPNLLLLDDKAVLALLTRRFTRTRPLVTHVLYGEWDDARVSALRERWGDPACTEPRWWIIKDAHASNGFSAALFDRSARAIVKKDVAGGYCYVVQEYVERPMLIDGRKFEMRQYVLILADGSAYTYDGALLRLACVAYDPASRDPRCHITNKFVQTGWEAESAEGRTLDDIERLAHDWVPYSKLLETAIMPIVADLADAVAPLIASGLDAVARSAVGRVAPAPAVPASTAPASTTTASKPTASTTSSTTSGGAGTSTAAAAPPRVDRSRHFELFACDLVVAESGEVFLMEVNINCAFGSFHPRTRERLIEPLFEDLVSLCVLPAAGPPPSLAAPPRPRAGRWRQVRAAGLEGAASAATSAIASQELREHQMWLTFKKSAKKKYERQFVDKEFVVSDVPRQETAKEEASSKCSRCGYFECRCGGGRAPGSRRNV